MAQQSGLEALRHAHDIAALQLSKVIVGVSGAVMKRNWRESANDKNILCMVLSPDDHLASR